LVLRISYAAGGGRAEFVLKIVEQKELSKKPPANLAVFFRSGFGGSTDLDIGENRGT
jgi:hypothetical protein